MPGFSKQKARKVLSEKNPTLQGKAITKKQRGMLGAIAGGKAEQLKALKRNKKYA